MVSVVSDDIVTSYCWRLWGSHQKLFELHLKQCFLVMLYFWKSSKRPWFPHGCDPIWLVWFWSLSFLPEQSRHVWISEGPAPHPFKVCLPPGWWSMWSEARDAGLTGVATTQTTQSVVEERVPTCEPGLCQTRKTIPLQPRDLQCILALSVWCFTDLGNRKFKASQMVWLVSPTLCHIFRTWNRNLLFLQILR